MKVAPGKQISSSNLHFGIYPIYTSWPLFKLQSDFLRTKSEAIKQKYLMFFLARGMIWLRETEEGPVFFFKWIGIKTTTPMISWQSQNETMTNVFDWKLNLEGASKWLVTGEIKKRCAFFSGKMTHPKWAASLYKDANEASLQRWIPNWTTNLRGIPYSKQAVFKDRESLHLESPTTSTLWSCQKLFSYCPVGHPKWCFSNQIPSKLPEFRFRNYSNLPRITIATTM